MIDALVSDGDTVIVQRTSAVRDGEMVVARLLEEDEMTLKRFYREKGRIRLQPANASLSPIYPETLEIRGVLRGVIRQLR